MKHGGFYRLRRIFAGVAAVAVAACVMPDTAWAYSDVYAQEQGNGYTTEEPAGEQGDPAVYGYIQDRFSQPYTDSDKDTNLLTVTPQTLESYYRTEKLPEIRNQNPYGTCWAFSSLALCEINLLKKGYDAYDLSELHLAYFATHSVTDPLGGLEGDEITYNSSISNFMMAGGNYEMALNALADWRGAVSEEWAPYSQTAAVIESGLPSELAYKSEVQLKNYISVPMQNTEQVKQAIVDYGAVGISYYASTSFYSNEYYNADTAGYYCPRANTTNHAVTIVGWDDTYPASNFVSTPGGDGAWIVRNSWGANYGDEGYFYLSYYDKSLSGYAVAFDVEPVGSYEHNYQYDGSMYAVYSSYLDNKAANVFTAHANENGAELLSAVSFELKTDAGTSYTIKIYTDLEDGTNPESGTLSATASGVADYSGMYFVELSEEVQLVEGETFSVVVEIDGGTVCADYASSDGYHESNCAAKEGESFCYAYNSWLDYGARNNGSIRIKAYTGNIGKKDVTGITLSHSYKQGEYFYIDKEYSFSASVTPTDATNQKITWKSTNPKVASVDRTGKVKALSKGSTDIIATSEDGGFSAKYTMNVIYALTDMKITGDMKVEEGNSITFAVTYEPTDIVLSELGIEWSVSDETVATIDAEGVLTALKPGDVTVYAYSALYDYRVSAKVEVYAHVPLNGWVYEEGVPYWYENDVKQGTTGRGKEIFDPESNAWYWLDAVDGGKMAVSKDVYQESEAGEWGDYEVDGVKMGKWVRYDEYGHMVKSWQGTDEGIYYFDPVYGTMAKGWAVIDGFAWYFDPVTGILMNVVDDYGNSTYVDGWHSVGGVIYWYENGVRQGYDPDNEAYRGKEIYDPDSDAWYWLDNVQDGAVAKSKDVYQESEAGEWGDYEVDGVKMGKWVRYDANGHMVKGWQTTDEGTYFFDYTYGTMAKGEAVINGKTYYFNPDTGILER